MDKESIKNKSLTKEETKGLLFLIEKSNIVNNKKTNAISNKMKVEEWVRIATVFNATIGHCRRTPQQLRLKWENLKKNSRKRSNFIRMERVKARGGPPGYFPPDEILDKVATLLGNTGEGFTAMCGGDSECEFSGDWSCETEDVKASRCQQEALKTVEPVNNSTSNNNNTSVVNEVLKNDSGFKRKLEKLDDGCMAGNVALTEYYIEKRKLVEAKIENIMLENENLKLQNEKLKLEISKLRYM